MTNELIKISTDAAGRTAVSGRELHEFLEIKDHRYTDWFSRMCEYGFVENQDFEVFRENPKNPQGGRPSIDHAMSIDMAKEISMIQRTDKGKEARRYFIECERQLREEKSRVIPPEQVLRIDGIPVDVPAGVPFSVTRSKTGVITVRVKPASTPTKAPAPVPAPAPVLPKAKGVNLSTLKYANVADKIVKYLYSQKDALMLDAVYVDKKIVPWAISHQEYYEILCLLQDQGLIALHNHGGIPTMTPIRY